MPSSVRMMVLRSRALLLCCLIMTLCNSVSAFAPPLTRSSFQGTSFVLQNRRTHQHKQQRRGPSSSSSLSMFLGSDGGLLGVGAPEVVTILLVGYFVLGPSDLYKLTKEIGKGIQNFRTLSSDVTKTFENNMESQLQLEELRKAQRELNDAFSFRRSIYVDDEAEAFAATSNTEETSSDATSDATTTTTSSDTASASVSAEAPKKKRKRKRVKKKKVEEPAVQEANGTSDGETTNVPDLEMPAPWDVEEPDEEERLRVEQELQLREDRMERLKTGTQSSPLDEFGAPTLDFSDSPGEEQERFAQQMSDSWNAQIVANSDELQPLAKVMERLAILEEEKKAADLRLEEEFRMRTDLEEKFYREKREILEDAAAEAQAGAYTSLESASTASASDETSSSSSKETKNAKKETTS